MTLTQGQELKEFNQLYREIDELYHIIAVKMGLSDSAFMIFYTLCDIGDGCMQKDICRTASMSKQTIHSAVRKMEREGYLVQKPGKGRDKHLLFTEKGRAFADEKILPVVNMENQVFAEMLPKERNELLRLTRKYRELMQKKTEELLKNEREDMKCR